MKKKIIIAVIVLAAVIGFMMYRDYQEAWAAAHPDFVYGNGRLEATEVSVTAKLPGRIEKVLVEEGDLVKDKQLLVEMQLNTLNASKAQAVAKKNQKSKEAVSAMAMIQVRNSEISVAKATIAQRKSLMEGAKKRYDRSVNLGKVVSDQKRDDDESDYLAKKADYEASLSALQQAVANLAVAQAEAEGKKAEVDAAEADIQRIQADIDDSMLMSTCRGRVQYRIAEPGEVLASGGRVLNIANLTDVYMTFFLSETQAGMVQLGDDVRIVLDALKEYPVPAKVSFVASVAQFTPKTVETQEERQKLMFRVKARVEPLLLEKHIDLVKTGLPGVAYIRINKEKAWPENLKTYYEKHPDEKEE